MCEICGENPCKRNCPNAVPKYVGRCARCLSPMYDTDLLWTDEDGEKFCTRECAIEYHGIESLERDEYFE